MDKQGIIHAVFGKVSFGADKLKENLEVILSEIKDAQPVGIKGEYIQTISISPSMGPGIRVAV